MHNAIMMHACRTLCRLLAIEGTKNVMNAAADIYRGATCGVHLMEQSI